MKVSVWQYQNATWAKSGVADLEAGLLNLPGIAISLLLSELFNTSMSWFPYQ